MQSERSEPFFNIPGVVVTLLALMVLIQLWRGTLAPEADLQIVARLAFVPGRLTFAIDPVGVMRHLAAAASSGDLAVREQSTWAGLFLRHRGLAPWTLLTYAFLHGGWAHLGLNGVWMVAFGTPVARRFGTGRFLVFMAVAAVWGALAHWLCYPFGFMPVIGASAAISGLMGTAVRFMFQFDPRFGDAVHLARPLPLVGVFTDRRAMSFVVVWFVSNTLFGLGAGSMGLSDAPIAWQAHVGGFLAGLVLFPWFDPAHPAQPEPSEESLDEDAEAESPPAARPESDGRAAL